MFIDFPQNAQLWLDKGNRTGGLSGLGGRSVFHLSHLPGLTSPRRHADRNILSTEESILSHEFLEALVLFILFIPPSTVKIEHSSSQWLLDLQVNAKNKKHKRLE